jgi:hypothetical protein
VSYYMGDYYRGGFFGSLFGVVKKAVGFIPGVGPLLSAGLSAIPTNGGAKPARASFPAGMTSLGPIAARGKAIVTAHPVLSAAAAAGALALAGGGTALARRGKGGVHPAIAAAAGMGRRRRRMHVTNVRALRRALRRTHGFAKLAMKVIRLEHPRKHGKFGGFKRKKRARV